MSYAKREIPDLIDPVWIRQSLIQNLPVPYLLELYSENETAAFDVTVETGSWAADIYHERSIAKMKGVIGTVVLLYGIASVIAIPHAFSATTQPTVTQNMTIPPHLS